MKGKEVEKYIRKDLGKEPKHNCEALANAITEMSQQLVYDECELMWLLLENRPINALHTHSYGFHTANGRHIIELLTDKYYKYES